MRSTHMTVDYPQAFTLSGYTDELPAGAYDLLVQEERFEGLKVHRWTAAYLTVRGKGRGTKRPERRAISGRDLETALRHGRPRTT